LISCRAIRWPQHRDEKLLRDNDEQKDMTNYTLTNHLKELIEMFSTPPLSDAS
jgi:hypothetical protein